MFNRNMDTFSYEPSTNTFTFTSILIEEDPLTTELEDLFTTKKDISSLRSQLNVSIEGINLSKFNQQELTVKKHYEQV